MDAATTTSSQEVRAALAAIAGLPTSVHACVFNLVWDEDLASEVAIVVMILACDKWDSDSENACATASDLAWDALTPLGVIADVICRTQSEHEAVSEAESWLSVDDACT